MGGQHDFLLQYPVQPHLEIIIVQIILGCPLLSRSPFPPPTHQRRGMMGPSLILSYFS